MQSNCIEYISTASGEAMSVSDAPALAGVHHLKLPVTDLARSLEWYRSRLGYEVQVEFVENGRPDATR
jgi:catechol-2,3-dioxygenase